MSSAKTSPEKWSLIIRPKAAWFNLNLKELWQYRDLIIMFVKRDFVSVYKQTILGPIWFVVQPMLTSLLFVAVFVYGAKLKPGDTVPPLLYYLSGLVCWGYFAETLTKISESFHTNAAIFGKVYFPRLVMPISLVISSLLKFAVQFALFVIVFIVYLSIGQVELNIGPQLLWFPYLLLLMGGLGLGFGVFISALTTKYRDVRFLVRFGVQLLMYCTPIIFTVEMFGSYDWIMRANPMTAVIEYFRMGFLGVESTIVGPLDLLYATGVMIVMLFLGIGMFSRVEKNFIDTL